MFHAIIRNNSTLWRFDQHVNKLPSRVEENCAGRGDHKLGMDHHVNKIPLEGKRSVTLRLSRMKKKLMNLIARNHGCYNYSSMRWWLFRDGLQVFWISLQDKLFPVCQKDTVESRCLFFKKAEASLMTDKSFMDQWLFRDVLQLYRKPRNVMSCSLFVTSKLPNPAACYFKNVKASVDG